MPTNKQPKYYIVHSVIDPQPEKILKILKDEHLRASSETKQFGIYHGEYLDYVFFSLFGDEKPAFGYGGVNFILDSKILLKRSFRYALKWVGNDLEKSIKVNYRIDNVNKVLDEINKHIINIDINDPRKMTSHEIMIKKKISLHRYLVAICCKNRLSDESIEYINKNYPNVKILDEFPESANELKHILA